MATPISGSRPVIPVAGKILEDYQWLAKNLAMYIHQGIPTHLEEHDGQVNYDDFGDQVIGFLNRHAPAYKTYDMRVFLDCLKVALKKRVEDLPFPHNRIAEPIFQRLMTELGERLLPKEEKHDRNPVRPGFSNTSRINSLHIGVTQGVGEKGTVAAGIFRSGDIGTAFSQYAAFHYQWINVNRPLLKAGVTSSIGAISLMPEDDFEGRYVLGVIPSLNLFLGSEQSLGFGLKLREAAEWRPSLPVGFHLATDLDAPFTAGAALERYFKSTRIYSGATLEWVPTNRDMQNPHSTTIALEKIQMFMGVESPLADARFSIDIFRNEGIVRSQLSKSVPFAGGLTTFALASQAPLNGTWNSEVPSFFFMIDYSQRTLRSQILAKMTVDLDPSEEPRYGIDRPGVGFDAGEVSATHKTAAVGSKATCDFSNYYKTGASAVSCTIPTLNNGAAIPCNLVSKAKEVHCSRGTGAYDVTYKISLDTQGNKLFSKLVVSESFVAKDPVLTALSTQTTRAGFVKSLQSLTKDQQLGALQQLSAILYKTYNYKALATLLGDDTTNLIGEEEIYQGARTYLFDPKSKDPTTVCRGIAKFVAGVAGDLGYEAHVVGLRTNGSAHAITLIREPDEKYMAINYGDEVGYTGHRDLTQALLQFAKASGYPPQLKFWIFDKDGQYERTINTNEGRLVNETTTAPGQAQDFLEFR